jgi:hypothetical protein
VQDPEIGWGPVSLSANCRDDFLFVGLPDDLTVLHWHGDTFTLPPAAQALMSNVHYANQAFRIGRSAWGVQFHLEVTPEAVEGFLNEFSKEAAGAPGGIEGIRAATPEALRALRASRDRVLARFARLVAAPVSRSELVDLG